MIYPGFYETIQVCCKLAQFGFFFVTFNFETISSCLTRRCYLRLYDSPPKSSAEEDEEISKMAPSQKKKLRQKQRKAEARAKKVNEFCLRSFYGVYFR